MTKLNAFRDANDDIKRKLLFDWLRDDEKRLELYRELRKEGFPPLRFESAMDAGRPSHPGREVWLLSSSKNVKDALEKHSVRPYAALDSGGRFMLGLEASNRDHREQRCAAKQALSLQASWITDMADEAVRRAMVLPKKKHEFDLVQDVAEQAALRFLAMLFGLAPETHVALQRGMRAAYLRLTFQIIGRHFVQDAGLPASESEGARRIRDRLHEELNQTVNEDKHLDGFCPAWRSGNHSLDLVATRALKKAYQGGAGDWKMLSLGLMAGTVGNITASIAIAVDHLLFEGGTLLVKARELAREAEWGKLINELKEVLTRHPPAPFLSREVIARGAMFSACAVPKGATLLLAMGADDKNGERLFGGNSNPHECVAEHLAWPLIVRAVGATLLLPGLSRVIDEHGQPRRLEKRWGAVCEKFPLQYQRDRHLNQQPLHVVLPIAEPVAENARKLMELTRAGAHIVEDALSKSRHVHFAWFSLAENGTHLAMHTVYDGDFDAYVEHFALQVSLFDEQFKFLAPPLRLPIRKFPKDFVEVIRKYNRAPMGDYFFSAYPRVGVADIDNAKLEAP